MFDVITFGSATLDVFLRSREFEVGNLRGEKDICVRYGAKLEVDDIFLDVGGGATNAAYTFARQGFKTACVAQVGDDYPGKRVVDGLKEEGVDTEFVDIQHGISTDYSTILWAGDGGRTVLVYRGKTRLEVGSINWEQVESKWFYIGSLEGNLDLAEKIVGLQSAAPVSVAWNPGRRELEEKGRVKDILPRVTVLNVNKEEMEKLLGAEGQNLSDEKILREAQKLPCQYVAITDDIRGSYLWDRQNKRWWHAGVFTDMPKFETTGAGDAYGSGLVSGLIFGKSARDSIFMAAANASSVVSQIGAKKGILRTNEIEEWKNKKIQIIEMFV